MSTKQRTTNTFQKAIKQDVDMHLQPNDSARYIFGARVIFNTGNSDLNGTTFSFTTEKGNKLSVTACPGFTCVGGIDLEDEIVSMWTNGTDSQIRTFKIDDLGNVFDSFILFDDRNDPNGDKLNFSLQHYIQCKAEIENQFNKRVYFWDNRNQNQPRCVNIELFYRTYKEGLETKKLPVHWLWDLSNPDNPVPLSQNPVPCGQTIPYPHWLSVHSFDWNTDVIFPKIKFVRRLIDSQVDAYGANPTLDTPINKRCALKTGIYQYFVRLETKDGYKTPISPITNHIFLTSMVKADDNHHDYTMYASNVVTPFGIEINISSIDTRYYKMEIGYVFSISDLNPSELTIFETHLITPGVDTVNIEHVNHTGIPLTTDTVLERCETILGVNTGAIKNNKIYFGGINSIGDLQVNVDNVTFKPFMRPMLQDKEYEPRFDEQIPPYHSGNKVQPATNSSITASKTYTINSFTGVTEDYVVENDYDNYKGMQFEHLFKAYWKGEPYGFGAVLFDRKGNPLFVTHIKDFKFPEMFESGYDNILGAVSDTAYTHTFLDNNDGLYKLKLMGLMLSGVRIPKNILFDKYGKMQVTGFAIVRNPRNKRIQHQGLIMNCTFEQNCSDDKDDDNETDITRPLPHLSNKFEDDFYTQNTNKYELYGRCSTRDKKCKISALDIGNRPHQFTYECPDLFVTGETMKHSPADYVKLVGTCHKAYLNDVIDTGHDHFYGKSYKTDNATNRYPLGSESRMSDVWNFYSREQRKPYDKDNTDLKFTNDIWGVYIFAEGSFDGIFEVFPKKDCTGPDVPGTDCFPTTGVIGLYYLAIDEGDVYTWNGSVYNKVPLGSFLIPDWRPALFSSGHQNTTVLKMKDFMHLDIVESHDSRSSYHIVNFMKPNEAYYTDQSQASLEVRQYISTGHFQKLDVSVLNLAKKVMKNGNIINGNIAVNNDDIEFYQFDDIEIWGGDCFLQFIDFARLMPYYVGACDRCSGTLLDYSVSHIVPLESNYNLMMRYGRTFAKVGTQPQGISCDNVEKHRTVGIMDRQPEDWNINAALKHQNNLQFYESLPFDIKITTERKATVLHSKLKTYSELQDSYRKVLRLNYQDLSGLHGEIIGMVENFDSIYCFQEKAYGPLRINERVTATTNLEQEALLGSGRDLDGIQYISTIYGTQHRDSLIRANNSIFWIDARMGKFLRFAQNGNSILSDEKGIHDVFTRILPYFDKYGNGNISRIAAAFDYVNNDVIFTLKPNSQTGVLPFTVAYSDTVDELHYYGPFTPNIYLQHKKFILSPDPRNTHLVYLHGYGITGQFYGVFHKSVLTFVVCDKPQYTKVFDNMLINMNKIAAKRIGTVKISTQNQIHLLNLKTDTRSQYKEDSLRFPLRELAYDNDRARDHFAVIEITINNDDYLLDGEDIQTIITTIDTEYRFSHKI